MHSIRGAAKIAFFFAAFKFIETLIAAPSIGDTPQWLLAAVVSFKMAAAGAALSALAFLGWVSRRLFGWPAPDRPASGRPSPPRVETPEMRIRVLGFNVVAGWVVLSVLALIMMADTGAGPIARLALHVFGPSALIGPETFILGLPAFAAPLVVLACLPPLTRPLLLASMQGAVKPQARVRVRRRRGR